MFGGFFFRSLVLKALVSRSGPLGLSALLPPANRVYPSSSTPNPISENAIPPHLPLGKDWQTIDFSLRAILGSGTWGSGVDIREFSQRLLERYRYVIGTWTFPFSVFRFLVPLSSLSDKSQNYQEIHHSTSQSCTIRTLHTSSLTKWTEIPILPCLRLTTISRNNSKRRTR